MAKSTPEQITPVPKEKRTEPYWQSLNEVIDPELNIGVVDLGLIYRVDIKEDQTAVIYMSLTSPMCPYGPTIIMQIEDKMRLEPNVKQVYTEIVWDPPWSQEMIDEDIRLMYFGG